MPPFQKKVVETPETPIETADAPVTAPGWTAEQLLAIVSVGMSVGDARGLLDAGFAPEVVLEIARTQASAATQQAAEAQSATAKAMQKAMKPENDEHPGHSVMSYPEGDKARPRVKTSYAVSYNGFPVSKFPEAHHWRELELIAQVQPGQFRVLRKDFSPMDVTVDAERDADGQITKLDIRFPVPRDEKHNIPPMMSVLYQLVFTDHPRQRFMESIQEYMNYTLLAATA